MIPALLLNDGNFIPQIGLGTYALRGDSGAATMTEAIRLGYRHLDTAARYENEDAVGEAIRRSGIDRDELFVTTKLDGEWQGEDRAVAGLRASLDRLGLEYVNLLLIHWPLPKRDEYVSTWKTFERLRDEGLTRSIGVSNFKAAHLDRLAAETDTVPAVNQVQLNPAVAREVEREDHLVRGIVTESYSPFGGDGAAILRDPVIVAVAERRHRTPGQVVARWHLENDLVAIPKSGNLERLAENLDLDFELTEEDLVDIATLNVEVGNDSDLIGH